MLGEPVAREAEAVGQAREVERVAQRLGARRARSDGRDVEDGEFVCAIVIRGRGHCSRSSDEREKQLLHRIENFPGAN